MRHLFVATLLTVIAVPAAAQDYSFTHELRPGDKLEIENINGNIEVTQGTGTTALVEVYKTVKRGNGNLVKAVMETSNGVMRVCTIYLNNDPDRSTCRGENSNSRRGNRNEFQVEMRYVVRVPSRVRAELESVNGGIQVRGLEAPASASTVNGSIDFEGVGANELETVNGRIRAVLSRAEWSGDLDIETVNGGIELSLPANFAGEIRGNTVNGGIDTGDFPVNVEGRWGPKSFHGTINGGGNKVLNLETVNGGVKIRKI
ncbi:MAG TPA: hypothetical protein PLL69_12560 [Gemmatimonadales bacterium]|nr:hypothetical protein [Gemmatimonadales bacterium]